MNYAVPADILAKARIQFCLQALEGKPYAWPAMEQFIERVGYGAGKISPSVARRTLADTSKVGDFIETVGFALRNAGIVEDNDDVQRKAERLFHIMTAAVVLENTDPITGRRVSFKVNVKAGVIVGGIFLVGGALSGPFVGVMLKKPTEKFDAYWNGRAALNHATQVHAPTQTGNLPPSPHRHPPSSAKRINQKHKP